MADRNNRGGRDRYDRQAEQFDTTEQSWRDDERGSGQMGESSWRDDDWGRSDNGRYSRERDFSRDRSYQRGTDYGRDYNRDQASSYRTGRYGSSSYGAERPGFSSFTSNDFGGRDFSSARYTGEGRYGGGYGAGTRLAENHGEWRDDESRGYGSRGRGDRGWFERAGEQIANWFGDDDDDRRGQGYRGQSYRGHGPSDYTRSDERIREDVNDALTDDWRVDARKIQVTVSNGEVTLDGTVTSRDHKRRAEDVVEDLSGVKHVQNNLRVQEDTTWNRDSTMESGSASVR